MFVTGDIDTTEHTVKNIIKFIIFDPKAIVSTRYEQIRVGIVLLLTVLDFNSKVHGANVGLT